MSNRFFSLFIMLVFLCYAPIVEAQTEEETDYWSTEEFPDQFKFWGGFQYLFGLDAKIRIDGADTGFGSTLDWDDDLDGDTTDEAWRAGVRWRFATNHAIEFSFYSLDVKGDGRLDQDFQIDNTVFEANGKTKSHIELDLYRFTYAYSFYRSKKVALSLSPGFYFGDFDAEFKGEATIAAENVGTATSGSGEISESLFAPLPTVGFTVEYKIFPRLTASLRTDYFYVDIADIEGSMAEMMVGLEYRLFKYFALGASYNRLWLDVDYKDGEPNGWGVDAKWNGATFYGALYF